MSKDKSRVSIGLPVFNGEKYLEDALDSILSQTYTDFELIISDNSSTDNTQRICRDYAAKDRRIHYYRNKRNLGAAENFNRVFALSSGEYFKWAAHDDILAPEFLSKCVRVLEQDPSIVLCHSKTGRIDEHGTLVDTYDSMIRINSWKPHERFHDLISIHNRCWPIFGVIRSSSLRRTPLIGNYIASDRNLLSEIGLLGRIYEIPECLFFRRDHSQAYTRRYYNHPGLFPNYQQQTGWWAKAKKISFPHWRNCFEYICSVRRAPLNWSERQRCYLQIVAWFVREGWILMSSDIKNVILGNSRLGRKFASVNPLSEILNSTLIPIIEKKGRVS